MFGAVAEAQQPKKMPRIGFLVNTGPDAPNVEPFLKGLRDLGYIEGKNILIDYRYLTAPDHAPKLVKELLQLKLDVFVSGASPAIRIAKEATSTTPIVMVIQQDPSRSNLSTASPVQTATSRGLPY